jgi:hypothetical protein
VNELCNGNPSEETLQLLRSLDRLLQTETEEADITKLYGTNFDARYINQTMLEEMNTVHTETYTAQDEGNVKLLRSMAVQKTISLKEGAPVILIKNIGNGLFNGTRGKVHKLLPNANPVIDFNGRLVTLGRERLKYSMRYNKRCWPHVCKCQSCWPLP